MIKIEVIQDGIPATFEKLRAHYPGTAVELHAINRNNIVVEVDKRSIKLKYLSVYYLIHNQFGEPGLVKSTEPIEWVIDMVQRKADKVYARLQKQYDNALDVARQYQETVLKLKEELSTNPFSLSIVLDLLASMHQGICPGAFAHWDIEKSAFDYSKQSTLDSFDFIDLAYSKACDLGIEKEFCEHMDSLPEMLEKDWMEGYERRLRLKQSKVEKARKNSLHYAEDIPKAVVANAQHYLGELNEEAILPQSEAPELVISLMTGRAIDKISSLELSSRLDLPGQVFEKGLSLGSFYIDKLSEYEAAKSYLDMIIYPSKWNYLGDEQYMKTKGWFHVWQVHLQDLQKLHQQGWKIDMYVSSGTKLVDPQLPPICEGNFVSNEPVEELTPVEEVAPDPEPSVAEQEVMQNEASEAREVVNVYVRLRIKLVNRRKVQVLELVDTIYYGVLHSGQEIVDDIPFNMDIHTVVKDLNTRNCLMPRTDPDKSIKIFPNFTSYAQEVYRDGKTVQLVIGVPTE